MAAELWTRKRDGFLGAFTNGTHPTPDEIREQLERIKNSDAFVRSARIQRLLSYLVDSVLAGQQDRLKESVIGIDVFDRAADYDPKVDPIVRVEVRRTRSKLSEFYLADGKSDAVLIWLEKGSYVPLLAKRAEHPEPSPVTNAHAAVGPSSTASETGASTEGALQASTIDGPRAEAALAPRRRSHDILYGLAAAGLILISVAAYLLIRTRDTGPSRSLRLFPLTGNAGHEIDPAFSPDGKQLAYSWDGNHGNLDIYVKPVENGTPRRLTDNAAHDVHPAWSPDGQHIAFLRVYPDRSQLVIIPASSGIETVVSERSPGIVRWHPDEPEGEDANGPVWAPDGSYLLSTGTNPQDERHGLLKTYLNGRQEMLDIPALGMNDQDPEMWDAKGPIAFVRTFGSNSADIFLLPGPQRHPIRLTAESLDIRGLAWLDAGHLIYSSDYEGSFRLWEISRSGGKPRPIAAGGARPQWPAVSRDGHWLAFVEATNDTNIWQVPLESNGQPGQAEPFISSAGSDSSPAFSPDGKELVFVSDRSGTNQLWLANSDGTEIRQLTDFKGASVGSPHWSPDGDRVVFDGALKGRSAIWLVDRDGGNLHQLNDSKVREYLPSWSRDGQWVYYTTLHDGKDQLWKQRPTSGELVQVTEDTFFDAAEPPVGDVIYVQHRQDGIWQIPAHGGSPQRIPELAGINPARYWTLVGDKLYFVRSEQPPRELECFDIKTRQIRKLMNIPSEILPGTPGLTVDAKHQKLLFVQKNQRRSSIMLQER